MNYKKFSENLRKNVTGYQPRPILFLLGGLVFATLIFFPNFAFATNLDVIPVGDSIQLGCDKQSTGCFKPKNIEINLGDTITFKNPNSEFHYFVSGNLNSGPTNIFSTGLIYPGDTFKWVPTEAGNVEFFCLIHPWMASSITINDSPDAKKNTDLPQTEKITICHIPPGNPDNPISITISASALKAHTAHGDDLGLCPVVEKTNDAQEKTKDNSLSPNDKVTICHIPPGNPDNPISITISASALNAHLSHGDNTDSCPSSTNTKNNILQNDPTVSPDDTVPMCHVVSTPITDEIDTSLSDTDSLKMCHNPSGKPENQKTIEVDAKSIKGHLAHGDKMNSCPLITESTEQSKQKKKDPSLTNKDRVTICHIPRGNPDNPITLEISASGLDAHFDHGDNLNACPAPKIVQKDRKSTRLNSSH